MDHNRHPEEAQLSASTNGAPAGTAQVLASYESNEGTRQLVAQRLRGKVALSDIPAAGRGRVYLIERHVTSVAELDAIVADYRELAADLRRPPMAADWIWR